jgi:hypothetical protein
MGCAFVNRPYLFNKIKFETMGKQDGIISLKGSIDKISFYKIGDEYLARKKGGIAKNRIATDEAFQRTRENGAEFARAGRAVKLLRTAVQALLKRTADRRSAGRMIKEMVKVIQADATSARGLRNVIDGEAELITGFEFNEQSRLDTTLFAPFTPAIDRVTGQLSVNVPSFDPSVMIAAPPGATHFKITTAGSEVDFENEKYVAQVTSSVELPLDPVPTAAIDLVNAVTPNSTHPLFLYVGIQFTQHVNGAFYPLKAGTFNALRIVKVSGV